MVMELRLEQALAPEAARLEILPHLDDVRVTYRNRLEQQGVAFPGAALEYATLQWDSWAAQLRGAEPMLDADGFPVDLSTFDREAVGALFEANRGAMDNAKKLDAIVDLTVWARATALAAEESKTGGNEIAMRGLAAVRDIYKRFIQLAMHLEEWGGPWQKLVATEFPGSGLTLPLDADGIVAAEKIMNDDYTYDLFKDIQIRYFPFMGMNRFNIRNGISMALHKRPEISDDLIAMVGSIGQYYRSSPAAADELLLYQVEVGTLPADVDWLQIMHAAVDRAAFPFREREAG